MLSNFGFILEILSIMLSDSGSGYVKWHEILLWRMLIFCFIRQSTTLGPLCKFLLAFYCLWFQRQFSFEVCSTTQICPACIQSGIWVMICLVVHFSKSLVCYLGSDTCMPYLGVSPEVYTWLHWITFLLSLHFIISSTFSDFLKAQGFSFLTLLHFPWFSHNIAPASNVNYWKD